MIAIADTLDSDCVALNLTSTTSREAIEETASLLRGQLPVLDWEDLRANLHKSAPCLTEADGTFSLCLPHARTDSVTTMVMSVGISRVGVPMSGCEVPVRYIFCIGVPRTMANDYLRIVGLLVRILKDPQTELRLRTAASGDEFVQRLTELEVKL
jgi:PTS system nitrogen regulatory IIA component